MKIGQTCGTLERTYKYQWAKQNVVLVATKARTSVMGFQCGLEQEKFCTTVRKLRGVKQLLGKNVCGGSGRNILRIS